MRKLQSQFGFSIMELIVVIFIIGLMSTVMFANYRQGERDTTLEYAAQGIAQDIRHAQNLSLAGTKLSDEDTWGYGIRFENNKAYFIYGDVGVTPNINYQYNSGDKKVSDSITLPTNVEISDFNITDIFFKPPDPITYINGSSDKSTVEIKICFTTTNKCKRITTTTAGRVEVCNLDINGDCIITP